MALNDQNYPGFLNPFGSDEEEEEQQQKEGKGKCNNQRLSKVQQSNNTKNHDDYPEYLSPFGEDENGLSEGATVEDYDNSLNPFGEEETLEEEERENVGPISSENIHIPTNDDSLEPRGAGNPFEEDDCDVDKQKLEQNDDVETRLEDDNVLKSMPAKLSDLKSKAPPPQQDSLEQPPVPLPRTKSLLKKEQAQKNRQQQLITDSNQNSTTNSILSTTSSTSSSSITTTLTSTTTTSGASTTSGSFQRKNHKRNAPPVPINFKRQVSGSLNEIECELNEIGDNLAIIEKESIQCQSDLKATFQVDERKFETTRSHFEELIKRKNSIVRRQKELMYRKRELKLDQIHSDIEYELRMIGNKQLSHRTSEDETKEKELLKKLVEIVEEKSDIVENLNRDTSCDSTDIEEAFKRLNITINPSIQEPIKRDVKNPTKVSIKNESCDKSGSVTLGNKFSKIATLLPKGGTIKGTMKIKRKRLFKKTDARPIER